MKEDLDTYIDKLMKEKMTASSAIEFKMLQRVTNDLKQIIRDNKDKNES